MKNVLSEADLAIRKKVWVELSEFYLDSELGEKDLIRKFNAFKNSGLSMDQIKNINYDEVGPLLVANLRSVAGEWRGFDQEWLCGSLEQALGCERRGNKNIFYVVTNYFLKREIDAHTKIYFDKITGFEDSENEY